MLYFAYGTDLSQNAVLDYCRAHKRPVPRRTEIRPAVLTNHRIQFSRHDPFFGGGVAGVVAETGKTVSGALMDISDLGFETLRRLSGEEDPASIHVTPLTGGPPLKAMTFVSAKNHQLHIPPTSAYLDRLINAAVEIGLSMMWVMQLQTFPAIASNTRTSPLRLELSAGPRGEPFRARIAPSSPVRPSIPSRPMTDRPAHELINC
jgi:hypothetical protein